MVGHEGLIEADGVLLDRPRRRVQVDGYLVHLQAGEAAVLSVLMSRCGQVVYRSVLLSAAGTSRAQCAQLGAVDRLLRRLRRRLEPSPLSPIRIRRVGENGYIFGSTDELVLEGI